MGGGSHVDEGQVPPGQGGPRGGLPRRSLPLSALVQLVRGIPEFLFREVPESDEASARTSPAEPASGLESTAKEVPGASEPCVPSCSPDKAKSRWNQERGALGSGLSPGSSPLQGLIDCLREILVPAPQHPEEPPSRLCPHPPLSSWRLMKLEPAPRRPPSEVKVEAAPAACVLQGGPGHPKRTLEACNSHASLSGTGQPPQREEPGTRERDSGASRASSSPLEALEACLKGIPLSGPSPPQPPTTSWSWSPQQGPVSPRLELRPHGSHSTEVILRPLLPLGLQGPVRDHPAHHPGLRGSSASSSSPSSSDGRLDLRSPEGSQRHCPRRGSPAGRSLPQGLERHLRASPQPKPQPAWLQPSSSDPGTWIPLKEAAKPSPLHHLENSLEGMLPMEPLRFSCLASPSPNPSPSSTEEDQRLEPEPGPLRLQGHVMRSSHQSGSMSMSKTRSHTSLLSAGLAGMPPRTTPQLEEQLRPCQPAGPTQGPGAWKHRGLGPGHSSLPVTGEAVAGYTLLEISGERNGLHHQPALGSPLAPASSVSLASPESPALVAAIPTRPPCPCRDLQRELCSLGATLSGKLDWLATTLASLSQDVASMKDQVNRLRRHSSGHRLKGGGSWPRPSGYKCPPYWKPPGPTRPRPKLLRGPGEGSSTGPPRGQRPPADTSPASAAPSGPTCGCAARTHLSPVPAIVSPQTALVPEVAAEAGPLPAVTTPASILTQRVDTGGTQETKPKGAWGDGHGDSRWGSLSSAPVLRRMPPPRAPPHTSIPAPMEPFSSPF